MYVHAQFLSEFKRTYQDLTPQLETVFIEVSTVQALRLRANPLRFHGAIHLPSMNWTYGDIGFYSGQTSKLDTKVCVKDENMQFSCKPLLN